MPMLPIPADADAWHALRAQHIGASEVAALFGKRPPYAPGLFALWHAKAGIVPPEPVDNPRVRWGLRLEQAIAEAAAAEEEWQVQPGQYASLDGLGATLDRIIAGPGPKERQAGLAGPGVLELKSADWLTHKKDWGDEPPIHILLQLQAQLLATGYAWGAVAVLVGGNDLRIHRYFPRPKIQAAIAERVALFWASVRAGKRPDPDGSDSAFRTLRELVPEVEDAAADLSADNEAPELAATLLRLAEERKAIERQEAEAKARLFDKLGPHKFAVVPGFRIAQAVTAAKPDRPAVPGEIIKGRAESRRLIVTERSA
jgi:predicted phage-related endonuclease